MALEKISSVRGTAVHVPGNDLDTDRIIPARYLKCITFDDLAGTHFYDVRFDTEGNPTGHSLDDPRFADSSIMLSGGKFRLRIFPRARSAGHLPIRLPSHHRRILRRDILRKLHHSWHALCLCNPR